MDLNKDKNTIKIQVKKKDIYFDSKEISEIYLEAKEQIIQNYDKFNVKPFYQIRRKKIEFKVTFDPERIEFWKKYETLKWENEIFDTIENYVSNDTYFVDIGAWIGPVSLYAKNYTNKLIMFEPDPEAFSNLVKNFNLNYNNKLDDKIILNELAVIADNKKKINLNSDKFGESGSSIYLENSSRQTQVNSINFLDMIKKYNLIDKKLFFKIDIEGYEYELLIRYKYFFKKLNASVFFSLHPINIVQHLYGKSNNKLLQVIYFINIYFRIFYKFPFKYILINRKKISLLKLILKIFLYGLPTEIHIFCTNKLIR